MAKWTAFPHDATPYTYDAAKKTLVVTVSRGSSAFQLVARW